MLSLVPAEVVEDVVSAFSDFVSDFLDLLSDLLSESEEDSLLDEALVVLLFFPRALGH